MRRHLILILGLALLGAFVIWRSPRPEGPRPGAARPAASVEADPPVPSPEPAARPAAPAAPPKTPPRPLSKGVLKITLEAGAAELKGRIFVYGSLDTIEAQREVAGEGRSVVLLERLPVGPKNVVYFPVKNHLPASAAAFLPEAGLTEVFLPLQETALLRGLVVDDHQRPLAGVKIEAVSAPLFTPAKARAPGISLWHEAGGHGSRRGSPMIRWSTTLGAGGELRVSVTSDADGEFELSGLPPGGLSVEVSYKELSFPFACTTETRNRIVVPVFPQEVLPDPEEEEARRRIHALLREMALHPGAEEPYAAQLREFLRARLAGKTLTPKDRARAEAHIEAIGRPR